MIVIEFYQWRRGMEQSDPVVTCPDCYGSGVTDEECPCCGQDMDAEDCGACEGVGRLHYSCVNAFQQKGFFTMRDYLDVIAGDLVAWSEWTGKPLLDVAIEAGFVLAYSITDQKPYLVDVVTRKAGRAA